MIHVLLDVQSTPVYVIGVAIIGVLIGVIKAFWKSHTDSINAERLFNEKTINNLTAELKDERAYNRQFGEAWKGMAGEFKIHLQNAPQPVKDLERLVSQKHEETQKRIKEEADGIKDVINS